MTIVDIQGFTYDLELCMPLSIHGQPLASRRGVIVQFFNDTGISSFGEIAPLPGASKETLQQSIEQLREIKNSLLVQDIVCQPEKIKQDGLSWMKEWELYPSLKFGLESGLYHMIASMNKTTLAQLFKPDCETHIYINGLLHGNQDETLRQAQEMLNFGIKTFKLKVGAGDFDEDVNKVLALKNKFGEKGLLRLDANQAWNLKEALQFGEAIGLDAVEYIEEPLKNIKDIPEFFMNTMIPVALDESLTTHSFDGVKAIEGVDVLIAKPTLLGGIEKTLLLIEQTQQVGMRTVLSSAFETGVGIRTLLNLAACGPRHIPVGLDTLKWFKEDTLTTALTLKNGYYTLNSENLHVNDINRLTLKEITL